MIKSRASHVTVLQVRLKTISEAKQLPGLRGTQSRRRYFRPLSRSGRLGGAEARRWRDKQPVSSTDGEPDSGRCTRWDINTQQKEEEEASETLC